jgi:hypothetical protein
MMSLVFTPKLGPGAVSFRPTRLFRLAGSEIGREEEELGVSKLGLILNISTTFLDAILITNYAFHGLSIEASTLIPSINIG